MPVSNRRFGNTLPVRLPRQLNERLKSIARAAGITKSDAMRLAISLGLPKLESGQIDIRVELGRG